MTNSFLIFVGMNDQLKDTKDFLQNISDQIHYFVAQTFPDGWILFFQILAKFILLFAVTYAIDFIFKFFINLFIRFFTNEEKYPFLKAVHKSRVTNSIAHILALSFSRYALYSVFYRHPKSFGFLERFIEIGIVLILANMGLRVLRAIELYYSYKKDFYRIVALKAISQTLQTFGIFIFSVIIISLIFGISGSTILGSLGAIMAVLVLVFRDTILGFVTGIHVATSRSLKVGDWIGIPKYSLEGTIMEINLITTKIMNFDKTVSTIPTYDLLSTEIKNLQVMSESNTRRIKRSIIFNINSFKFLDDELLEKLSHINLISNYLQNKKAEMNRERQSLENSNLIINGRQLTNIGVFREYAFNYLKNNEHIDQEGSLLVRQLENTPQGMPLEIYCFTNDSTWSNYEDIQADIFDHLLVASREFDLEIMQMSLKV